MIHCLSLIARKHRLFINHLPAQYFWHTPYFSLRRSPFLPCWHLNIAIPNACFPVPFGCLRTEECNPGYSNGDYPESGYSQRSFVGWSPITYCPHAISCFTPSRIISSYTFTLSGVNSSGSSFFNSRMMLRNSQRWVFSSRLM